MSLIGNILNTYRGPEAVISKFLHDGAREERALAFLAGGCVIAFVAQWPKLARQAFLEEQALDMLMGATLYAWIFVAPLMFYLLAGFVQLVGYLLGSKRTGAQTRTVIFWAFLATGPLLLLVGAIGGFIGESGLKTVVEVIWLISFLWFVISGLRVSGKLSE